MSEAQRHHGVRTRYLDVGAASTLRGRRVLWRECPNLDAVRLWPDEWRALLRDWLKPGRERHKWTSLLKTAGHDRAALGHRVLEALLQIGTVEVEERREGGRWHPVWVRFTSLAQLCRTLGLPDRGQPAAEWKVLARCPIRDVRLENARRSLDVFAPARAVRRMKLLISMEEWLATGRSGTRRDFAYAATGDTKGISSADWEWLEDHLDLPSAGIQPHTPAVWLRAPLVLRARNDRLLDLRCAIDCIALTHSTIEQVTAIEGDMEVWRVVENRTMFERIARSHGHRDAVVWLPGFPPPWWLSAMGHLVAQRRAPAFIGCDPDPAGIHIALLAGQVWERQSLTWTPWLMDVAGLAGLKQRKTLTDADRQLLANLDLSRLPRSLQRLAEWMLEHQEKGEQEGLVSVLGNG